MRLRRACVVLVLSLLSATTFADEPLPGLLRARKLESAREEGVRQKADAQATIRRIARNLGYRPEQIEAALTPTMDRRGHFRVTLDDGTVVEFPWYRIGFAENSLANTGKAIGQRAETHKGGIRLHFGVTADEVYALALKMESKLAIARDALGDDFVRGAKGGIGPGRVVKVGTRYQAQLGDAVDPASPVFDRAELMRQLASSYRAAGGEVGPGFDIQAGDVNT